MFDGNYNQFVYLLKHSVMYFSFSFNFEYSLFPPCLSFLLRTMNSSPSHTGAFHIKIKHQIFISTLECNESFPSTSSHIFYYNIFSYQCLFINTLLQYFVCSYRLDQKAFIIRLPHWQMRSFCLDLLKPINRPHAALKNSHPIFEES